MMIMRSAANVLLASVTFLQQPLLYDVCSLTPARSPDSEADGQGGRLRALVSFSG